MPLPRRLLAVLSLAVLLLAVGALLAPTPPAAASTWVWPLPGHPSVTRAFAPGPSPWSPGHRGVDLAGAPGLPVLAVGDGVVTWAGPVVDRDVVVVLHGVLRTTYEPVTPDVQVGQAVRAGQPIGTLDGGHPGCPAPACLHWGLLRGDTYLDPLALLGLARVRLLPRDGTDAPPALAPPPVPAPAVVPRAPRSDGSSGSGDPPAPLPLVVASGAALGGALLVLRRRALPAGAGTATASTRR